MPFTLGFLGWTWLSLIYMRETMPFTLSFIGSALLSLRRDSVLSPQLHRVNIMVIQREILPFTLSFLGSTELLLTALPPSVS
jgi:hypothetical protein